MNELIKNAVEQLRDLPHLKAIILYGSYARGDFDRRSDIDLLIIVDAQQPKKFLKEVIKRVSSIDPEGKISPRLTNFKDYDPAFFQNVLREGRVLFGSLVVGAKNLALQPYRLINYDLTTLPASVKVRISRRVYGYTSLKGAKKYRYQGLADEEGVFVFPTSTVLLPESNMGFISFLKRENVPFEERKVWM